jgi:hypothetical protein
MYSEAEGRTIGFFSSQRRWPKIRFSVFRSLHLLMDDPEELQLRRQKIQGEINGYRGTAGDNDDDERTRLKLETALLKLEMIDIKITATNEIKTKEQLLLRLLPPQTQEIQPGNYILSHFIIFIISLIFPFFFSSLNTNLSLAYSSCPHFVAR